MTQPEQKYERIWVEKHGEGVIAIDVDGQLSMTISHPQAMQLIIDLTMLVKGIEPTDEPTIDGVE